MADETDEEQQQRLALEEFQRQQAAQAVQASEGQPNAIPTETSQGNSVRAVDYAQQGLPTGNVPIGDTAPNAPQTGFYVSQIGENLGPTVAGESAPQGSVGIQGQLSDEEQNFWAANPLGAVKDPNTGNLIGLGSSQAPGPGQQVQQQPVFVNAGLGGPGQAEVPAPFQQERVRQEIPNFVNVPEVDPNIAARRDQISAAIADIDRRLPSSQTQRVARGQPSERERLIAERSHYVTADNVLAQEMHNQNQARSHASDLNMKMRDQYATNQDATGLREDFNKIKSQPGTAQYASDLMNLRLNHPDAMRDPRSVELLDKAATAHDQEAAFLARAQAQGVQPQLSGFHQGRATYTIPKTGDVNVPVSVQNRYARLQADQQYHTEQSAAEAAKNTALPNNAGANIPYSQAANLHATQAEMRNIEQRFPQLAQPQATSTPAAVVPTATPQPSALVTRTTADGRQAIFDSQTKKFLRYAQ